MGNITFDRTIRRKRRISTNISGTSESPRISVFRSNKYIYAQAIDDAGRKTLASSSSLLLLKKPASNNKMTKTEIAQQVGIELAKKLIELNITKGVFDRSSYSYLGRVKSLAEGLREGGLKI